MGPGIGDGELTVVHFIINRHSHCALKPAKRLVTSSDTDQPILTPLAMATGRIAAVDTSSDSQVKLTINRMIHAETDYLYVNRVLLRVDINAGLKLLGFAYISKHEAAFAQVANNPLVVLKKEDQNLSGCLCSIAQGSFDNKDWKCSNLCLPEQSMELQLLRADAVLKYWQAAFELKTMPELCCEGR